MRSPFFPQPGERPALPSPEPNRAMPFDRWPASIKVYAAMRQDGDRGVGDIAARHLASLGAASLAEALATLTGGSCHCEDRRAWLNRRYPFAEKTVATSTSG